MRRVLLALVLASAVLAPGIRVRVLAQAQDPDAPKILLDQSLRAVEYQLNRLTNDQLVRVERNTKDAKYRPVYVALLTRKGLPAAIRDEAVAALVTLDKVSAVRVLMDALSKVAPADTAVGEKLVSMLFAQSAQALKAERDFFAKAPETATQPFVLRGAYGGLMLADGTIRRSWDTAFGHDGHFVELLRALALLPPAPNAAADAVRTEVVAPLTAFITITFSAQNPAPPGSTDATLRAEAILALAAVRRDPATFSLLAREITGAKPEPEARAAAIRGLQLIPETAWPTGDIEPLANAILALVKAATPDMRTESPIVDALQLGDRLAAALPEESRRKVRQDLRALGVQIVRIETLPEQMLFDVRWFVVEARAAVQIVLLNKDSMPHNLLVAKPKSVMELGTATLTMSLPTDPDAKPYVPASPAVLHATPLIKEDETAKLGFTAPTEPGEYVFLCSFPGHYLRMYGVMLVVPSLEAWESHPTVPTDPMTGKPFAARLNGRD